LATLLHRVRSRMLGRFGSAAGRGWRTRRDPVRGRRGALRAEVAYWEEWLATKGGKWGEEYAFRFDPAAEVSDPALRRALSATSAEDVSIVDVGAGPASIVGCRFPGKRLTVIAVDPLADSYARLLAKANVVPPVRTACLHGEHLVERFGHDRFDIAYARNALDHAVDPTVIIEQMLDVVRVHGYVVLRHVRNEAERQAYGQLHQWNFEERDGQLVVWRAGHETRVGDLLADRCVMTCHTEPADDSGAASVVCVIRKVRPDTLKTSRPSA
jgi:SAM-dependent methyltransferase